MVDIRLTFEEPSYTISEDAGRQEDLISICKQDDALTERTLEVFVQLNPPTGSDAAINGKQFMYRSNMASLE